MNILERMEERLNENKAAFKTYATATAATKAIEKKIEHVAALYGKPSDMDYMTMMLPSVGRFAVIVDFSSWMRKHDVGGYVGVFAASGFWSK